VTALLDVASKYRGTEQEQDAVAGRVRWLEAELESTRARVTQAEGRFESIRREMEAVESARSAAIADALKSQDVKNLQIEKSAQRRLRRHILFSLELLAASLQDCRPGFVASCGFFSYLLKKHR